MRFELESRYTTGKTHLAWPRCDSAYTVGPQPYQLIRRGCAGMNSTRARFNESCTRSGRGEVDEGDREVVLDILRSCSESENRLMRWSRAIIGRRVKSSCAASSLRQIERLARGDQRAIYAHLQGTNTTRQNPLIPVRPRTDETHNQN